MSMFLLLVEIPKLSYGCSHRSYDIFPYHIIQKNFNILNKCCDASFFRDAVSVIDGMTNTVTADYILLRWPEPMLEEFWLELAWNSAELTNPLLHLIVRGHHRRLSGFNYHIPKDDQVNALLNTIS